MECFVCYDIEEKAFETCKTCKTNTCFFCSMRLVGRCPICKREELNSKIRCSKCRKVTTVATSTMCHLCEKFYCHSQKCMFSVYDWVCIKCKDNFLENTMCLTCGEENTKCVYTRTDDTDKSGFMIDYQCEKCYNSKK